MTAIENIDTIETAGQSVTATVCENAALYGAPTPERDEFDPPRGMGRRQRHRRRHRSLPHHRRGRLPGRVPVGRRAREPALGLRQLPRRPGPPPRPLRRPAQPGAARPPARPGRHRDQVPRAGTRHRDRARNLGDRRDAFETMRDAAAESYLVKTGGMWRPPARIAQQPDRQADLGRHRRPRLPARPQGPQDASAPARGHPGRYRRRQGHRQPGSRHRAARHSPRQVCRHGAGPRRRTRRREDRGKLGRAQRRPPGCLQAGLGPPRARRPVQAQRRAPQPPAEGRDRVPRFGHHREPRRQGTHPGYPGSAHRGLTASPRRAASSSPGNGRWRRGPFLRSHTGGAASPSSGALRAALVLRLAVARRSRLFADHGAPLAALVQMLPNEPAVTALDTPSHGSDRTSRHSIAVAAPPPPSSTASIPP